MQNIILYTNHNLIEIFPEVKSYPKVSFASWRDFAITVGRSIKAVWEPCVASSPPIILIMPGKSST